MLDTYSKISFQDEPAVLHFLGSSRIGLQTYDTLRKALYRERKPWTEALALVPQDLAEAVDARFVWIKNQIVVTREDGTSQKALWQAQDGSRFESVLMHHRGRATLCVSCQVGCAVGCQFCATGQQGWARNLQTWEILEQAAWARDQMRPRGKGPRNVVFMGQGEPLLAMDQVGPALQALLDQRRFEIAPRYLSVSTCGVIEAIEPFYRQFPLIKLAVSLHAPRQTLRDQLMPGCRAWPLRHLLPALHHYGKTTGHELFLEYILIAGVNDSPREAQELALLFAGHEVHVNLIPYNPSEAQAWKASDRSTIDEFQRILVSHGLVATVRHSAGIAVQAACGQLAGKDPRGNNNGNAWFTEDANRN